MTNLNQSHLSVTDPFIRPLYCRITVAKTQVQIADTQQELEQKRATLEDLTGKRITQLRLLSHIPNTGIPSIDQIDEYLKQSLKNNNDYLVLKKALPATQPDLAQMKRRITQGLRLSILGMRAAKHKIQVLDSAVKDSVQYVEIIKSGYKAGLSAPKEVMDAIERFGEIKHRQYQALVDLVMHLLKFNQLTGNLDESQLLILEKWFEQGSSGRARISP